MSRPSNRLDEARTLYARMMAAASGSADPRLERIFELVPREAFLPPGPWHVMVEHRLVETPSAHASSRASGLAWRIHAYSASSPTALPLSGIR